MKKRFITLRPGLGIRKPVFRVSKLVRLKLTCDVQKLASGTKIKIRK